MFLVKAEYIDIHAEEIPKMEINPAFNSVSKYLVVILFLFKEIIKSHIFLTIFM